MVLVSAGSFSMGWDGVKGASPTRRVTISRSFYLDRTEVTVEAYGLCVAAGKCKPAEIHGPEMEPSEIEKFEGMCNVRYPDRSDHPVNCVDQAQATAFCGFVSKRLPTEAEWELAARGEAGRKYPWGDEEPGCSKAVVSGCAKQPRGKAATLPVGSFPSAKSPEGAVDQAGNVWEWVSDGWDPEAYKAGAATDPKVEAGGAFGVIRGGSWDFAPSRLVSYHRQKFNRKIGHVSTGIRCVRDATSATADVAPPHGSATPAPEAASAPADGGMSAWERVKAKSVCASLVSWGLTRPLLRTGRYGSRLVQVLDEHRSSPGPIKTQAVRAIGADADKEASDLRTQAAAIEAHAKLPGEEAIQAAVVRDFNAVAALNERWGLALGQFGDSNAPRASTLEPLAKEIPILTQRVLDAQQAREAQCEALKNAAPPQGAK